MNTKKFLSTVLALKASEDFEGLYNMIWQTSLNHEIEVDRKTCIIEALEQMGSEKAMETVAKIMTSRPSDYGEMAAKALSRMGTSELAVQFAVEAYENGEASKSSIRGLNAKTSVQIVINSLGEKAVGPLLNILTNEKKSNLSNLINEFLYSCITDNSIELLRKRLLYPDRWIREIVTNLLISVKWEPSTIEEKVTVYISKNNWEGLEGLGEPAVEYLAESMDIRDNCLIKRNPKIMHVLGKTGSSKAIDPLVLSLKNNSFPRAAIKALGEIGDPVIITPILDHISSKDHLSFLMDSSIYIKALSNVGEPAINELRKVQYDPDKNVQKIVKKALKRLMA